MSTRDSSRTTTTHRHFGRRPQSSAVNQEEHIRTWQSESG